MKLYIKILFCGLILVSQSVYSSENEFDKVCGYFNLLAKKEMTMKMTPLERNNLIQAELKKNLNPHSDARVAWESISSAVAEQRYELYKSAAESVLKTKWSCNSMKIFASKTGYFNN